MINNNSTMMMMISLSTRQTAISNQTSPIFMIKRTSQTQKKDQKTPDPVKWNTHSTQNSGTYPVNNNNRYLCCFDQCFFFLSFQPYDLYRTYAQWLIVSPKYCLEKKQFAHLNIKKPNEVHHHCHHLSRSVIFKYPVPLHDWKHTGNAFQQQQQVKVSKKRLSWHDFFS